MTSVYVFGLILAVLLVAVVVAPLLERGEPIGAGSPAADRLALALDALREIEFEHETDKLSDEDYSALRQRYAADAIAARDAGATSDSDARPNACAVCDSTVAAKARFCSRCGTEVAV